MTLETIIENCNRIMQFFKQDIMPLPIGEPCAKELLKWVGRILDFNGASARNQSRLYLSQTDFESLIKDIKDQKIIVEESHITEAGCNFLYDCYYWEVVNEDYVRKTRINYLELSKQNNQQ